MSKQILITAIALSGLMLGACEKDASNGINQPERAEPVPIDPSVLPNQEPTGEPEVAQQQAAQQPESQIDLEVLPAVTVISVEFECAESDVYFPTASAELDTADKAALDSLAACLKGTKTKEQIEITATADPRGTERYNEALSRQRAEAVAQYLQQQGVKESNFQIRARGEQGMVEGIPMLWPLQRGATVEPKS